MPKSKSGVLPIALMIVGALLAVACSAGTKPTASQTTTGCGADYLRRLPVDLPVHQSIADIFGIRFFITKEEWELVKERVLKCERGTIDTDGDGDPDISIFIESGPNRQYYPILVKVLDNDDDMTVDGLGDKDSDTWLADWRANGIIDRIVDYQDFDSDNDVDQLVIYYSSFAVGSPGLIVSLDVGDDNKIMAVSDYQYDQCVDQWRSHFNGDEYLAMFYYDSGSRQLVPINEVPFAFYDPDHDGLAEIALRLQIPTESPTATGEVPPPRAGRFITSLRYSFDIDNDADEATPHDYDFSFTAIGGIPLSGANLQRLKLRNMLTEPVVLWSTARDFAAQSFWKAVSLTWDEDDFLYADDKDECPFGDTSKHQRWEGVHNRGSEYFPLVGGPPSREWNKRTEVDRDYSGRMGIYYSEIDKRTHLLGAEVGWMKIDYDYDGKLDMLIRYSDTDGNGIFDKWEVDIDGDGVYDRVYVAVDERATPLSLEYSQLSRFYISQLSKTIKEQDDLIRKIKEVMQLPRASPIEAYYLRKLGDTDLLGQRLARSDEAKRFYLGLILEGYFADLVRHLKERQDCAGLDTDLTRLFNQGEHSEVQRALEQGLDC